MRKIRILLMFDQIFDSTGGTEQHISFLIKNLPRKDYDIFFSLLRDTGYYSVSDYPVEPIIFNFRSFFSIINLIQVIIDLIKFIRQKKIDIIHSFSSDSELLALLATRITPSVKFVVTRRNMGYTTRKISKLKTNITTKLCNRILVNCLAIKRRIVETQNISPGKN